MVVDDYRLVLNSLVDLLQSAERKFYPALSAEEALQLRKAYTIDVALIDARMCPVSGIEWIAILRKKYLSIKIVGIIGFHEEATIADFLHVGSIAYWTKRN